MLENIKKIKFTTQSKVAAKIQDAIDDMLLEVKQAYEQDSTLEENAGDLLVNETPPDMEARIKKLLDMLIAGRDLVRQFAIKYPYYAYLVVEHSEKFAKDIEACRQKLSLLEVLNSKNEACNKSSIPTTNEEEKEHP